MFPTNPKIPITGIITALKRNHKVESEKKAYSIVNHIHTYNKLYSMITSETYRQEISAHLLYPF